MISLPLSVAFLLSFLLQIAVVHGAIPFPHQWEDDVTQEELDELIERNDLIDHRLERCNELPGWESEDVYKLTNASVVLLDEELLCADFQQTCDMASRKEKEEWLLDRAAWFSAPHIEMGIHTNLIPHDPSQRKNGVARRPCAGGRVLLLPVEDGDDGDDDDSNHHQNNKKQRRQQQQQPWLDVKGVGTRDPKDHSRAIESRTHTNGLFDLFAGLWEYANEKTLAAALAHHKRRYPARTDQHFDTVGIYAVLSFGFEFPFETYTEGQVVHFPAASLVRQAARRNPSGYGFMDVADATVLEQIMNAYGMRCDSPGNDSKFATHQNNHCRRVNIQGTYRPRTMTDLINLYVDEVSWPIVPLPNDDLCLVHWANTEVKFDTPLWKEHDLGSREVREFLAKELKALPASSDNVRLQTLRSSYNVRAERLWQVTDDFWHGRIGVSEVEEAVRVGLIDDILLDATNGGGDGGDPSPVGDIVDTKSEL